MHAILTLHEKVRTDDITRRASSGLRPFRQRRAVLGRGRRHRRRPDQDDDGTTGWNPNRPDAVHLGTPKRNPIIARSVGEPL